MIVPCPGMALIFGEALRFNTIPGFDDVPTTAPVFQRLRGYRNSDVFQDGLEYKYWSVGGSGYPVFSHNRLGFGAIEATGPFIVLNAFNNATGQKISINSSGWLQLRYVSYEVHRRSSMSGQPSDGAVNNSTNGDTNQWRTLFLMTLPENGSSGLSVPSGSSMTIEDICICFYSGIDSTQYSAKSINLLSTNTVTVSQANALGSGAIYWAAFSSSTSDATRKRYPVRMCRAGSKLYFMGMPIVGAAETAGTGFWSYVNLFTAQTGGSVYKSLSTDTEELNIGDVLYLRNDGETTGFIGVV